MRINILRSSFQTDEFVWREYAELLQGLKDECLATFEINGDTIPDVVMIATGGVESQFKTLFAGKGPVTLIADGRNNSLAAALEILTWLESKGVKARILHGTNAEIFEGLMETSLRARIGLFGAPSDWLIASGVDRAFLFERYGTETVDIDLQRLIDGIKAVPQDEAEQVAQDLLKRAQGVKEPSQADLLEAAKAYLAIKKICQEERLDAMTIRCFDIVNACGTTSCLALALLNDEGIVAGCEGDMQTLMSMLLVKRLCGQAAFMANPSQLNAEGTMLAHCTIPLSMCDNLVIRSHFESGIGVAIQGMLPMGSYTIFKWGGPKLDRYFVTETLAMEAPYSDHFCRTQITVDTDLRDYLLEHSIGNHHVVIRGRHAEKINEFMEKIGAWFVE